MSISGGPFFPGSPRSKDLAVANVISLPDRVSLFLSFCEASLRVGTAHLYTYVHSKAVTRAHKESGRYIQPIRVSVSSAVQRLVQLLNSDLAYFYTGTLKSVFLT